MPRRRYLPGPGRRRPTLPIAAALAADGAERDGFSRTLFALGWRALAGGWHWEAHECWEVLWRREPAGAPRRVLLQGLILLAAAQVKRRQGRPAGAVALRAHARVRLEQAARAPGLRRGYGLARALALARRQVGPARGRRAARRPGSATPRRRAR